MGKSEAIEKIARVIRVRQSHLKFRAERPDGSFLLLGPPGVGKNEIAYSLADILYGTEAAVVSVDLGEIDDEEDMAKLGVTAIPGMESHLMEGMLTSPVRENPESIILLRGLERAHPAFQRLLLQILDRGRIEDMLGTVDFRQSIIFVTMHLTREDLAPGEIGFGRPSRSAEEQQRVQLERYVSPDLLDAFNEVIELPP
ncbi:MAG: AAA family ATPase [Candidatus Eisenbacteria bacterium]